MGLQARQMRCAIIDIGSNSVRLAIFADGNVIYRDKNTTRLGEGLSLSTGLDKDAATRTFAAISNFVNKTTEFGIEKKNILPFATAAVRQAINGKAFINAIFEKLGIKIDLLSEEQECLVAVYGALPCGKGAVLDVGGASSELVVAKDGKITYSKSLDEGAVKLTDKFYRDFDGLNAYLEEKIQSYNAPKIENLTAIGGTAGCLAYILSGDKIYDRTKNHGRYVSLDDLYLLTLRLKDLSVDETATICNVEKSRAKTLFCGGVLICRILTYLGLKGYTLSESDNLEGYYLMKIKGDGYEEK